MGHDLGMQSRVHPKYKTKYRVTNWAAYDRALVQRGDLCPNRAIRICSAELRTSSARIREKSQDSLGPFQGLVSNQKKRSPRSAVPNMKFMDRRILSSEENGRIA